MNQPVHSKKTITPAKAASRTNDPARTMADILRVATEEFADNGNEDYIRLVMNENIARGAFLAQSKTIQELNVPAIRAIQSLYERGVKKGVFRAGLDPVDIHASISALTFFNVSNQHTFGLIFKTGKSRAVTAARRRSSISDMVMRFVQA